MKRRGNLFPQIVDFENLILAAKKAQKGKRFRENVLRFNYNFEAELLRLKEELESKTYRPGPYKAFEVILPKKRLISAAPYRDRVVHHALINIVGPIFEATFIADSYANRVGFGTHRALKRFAQFARSSRYVLQCDVKKYFPSIDHEILKAIIRRKIKCQDTLWLIDAIIDGSNEQEPVLEYFPGDDLLAPCQRRRGLPIGNLSSQFFANLYLNGFDNFVKEKLKVKKYIRYADDFAFFGENRQLLADARVEVEAYLAGLRLKIHPIKSQLFETKKGANFVGFRVLPNSIRVRSKSLRWQKQQLKKKLQDYLQGEIEEEQMWRSLQSRISHWGHADTKKLQQKILSELITDDIMSMVRAIPDAARWLLEQQSEELSQCQS